MRVRVILFVIAGVILSSGCGGSSSSVSIPQNSPDITAPSPENEPPTQSRDITEPNPSPENESQDTNPTPEILTYSPCLKAGDSGINEPCALASVLRILLRWLMPQPFLLLLLL
ncbi:MAG: hypothetical protein IKQ95_02290 [Synergistaceae bacterium]|nr:hypothetical protein [Synergistaceae bacterium]